MSHDAWTPLIGAKDIYRHVRARAPWGALFWAIALAIALQVDVRGPVPTRMSPLIPMVGGVAAGVVMSWRVTQRHQWAGWIPYLLVTLAILLVIVPMTCLAHLIWGFASAKEFHWVLGFGALGALLRGVGATDWMTPYRRNPSMAGSRRRGEPR